MFFSKKLFNIIVYVVYCDLWVFRELNKKWYVYYSLYLARHKVWSNERTSISSKELLFLWIEYLTGGNQKEVADRSEINPTTLSRIKNGNQQPRKDTIFFTMPRTLHSEDSSVIKIPSLVWIAKGGKSASWTYILNRLFSMIFSFRNGIIIFYMVSPFL